MLPEEVAEIIDLVLIPVSSLVICIYILFSPNVTRCTGIIIIYACFYFAFLIENEYRT